jgi:hypothetical protein
MIRKFAVALVACTCLTAPALAQQPTPAERAQMEAELRELNAMQVEFDRRIRNLEKQLGAGAAGGAAVAAAPPASSGAKPAAVATAEPGPSDEAGTYAEAVVTDKSFEVYGFAQLDYIQDFKRVNPDWDATLRPSKIPTTEGAFGGNGQSVLSVRQTRFGVKGSIPAGNSEIKTQFEFDLFGVGVNAGQTTFRLRHAWGSWGPILAGQTNSLFMDGDLFPNTIDYWGPTGMVFLRNPQIRYTFKDSDGLYFAAALETANTDVDIGQIRELDPSLGDNLRGKSPLPDLTIQARVSGDWGHLQVAGLLTKLAFETDGTPDNEPKNSRIGGGINASAILNAGKSTVFRLGVVYGNGIASYMNDGGMDLAPVTDPGSLSGISPKAVPLLGVTAYVDHNWSPKFSSALGYSITKVWNTDLQEPDAFESGQYASTNLLWYPVSNVMIGGELLWGKRTDFGGDSGDDIRMQFSFKYNFSTGNIFERKAK